MAQVHSLHQRAVGQLPHSQDQDQGEAEGNTHQGLGGQVQTLSPEHSKVHVSKGRVFEHLQPR